MLSQRQLFLEHVAQTTDFPLLLEVDRAEGIYLHGPSGEKYIDLISGISVSNIGHRHPKVIQAIKDQLDKYLHLMVYGELVQSPQVQLAEKLASLLPPSLSVVYYLNSGSEAIEGAMKLAKRYTGRPNIVCCKNAYHGSSQGALSLNGSETFRRAFRPLLPGIRQIEFGNPEDLKSIDHTTAAVFIETVQGEAGVRVASVEYFQKLKAKCVETGTLLVMDEIQTGFGRTGKFWGFEHYGITPDILVCAKAMGGGMPLSAFISSAEIMSSLRNDPILGHITTFGGHPVSCAASLATIDVLLDENLIQSVGAKEKLFHQLLVHPAIRSVRSKGLLLAVEFENFDVLKRVIDKCIKNGLLTDWFLFCNDSMRIAPPLVITENEIETACKIILASI